MPNRTVTQQGRTPNIDLRFITAGHTSKSEVVEKLVPTNTRFENDRFFIGRWRTSKWAGWIALGTPAGGGGVAGERFWRNANLIVKFDERGAVERYEVSADNLLTAKLAPIARGQKLGPREELKAAILFGAGEIPVKLVLAQDSIEIEELLHLHKFKHRPQYHYTAPIQEFRGVTLARNQENISFLETSFHFARDLREFHGPSGKKVGLELTVPQLITVLSYAAAHESPSAAGR